MICRDLRNKSGTFGRTATNTAHTEQKLYLLGGGHIQAMPIRRPSVSAEPAQSSIRVHRSNDSHHVHTGNGGSIHPPSVAYAGASTTPQQKSVVQALINNRIKKKVRPLSTPALASPLTCQKLPIHSGLSLDIVESDPATQSAVGALVEIAHESLDIISLSLSELLERLAKVLPRPLPYK